MSQRNADQNVVALNGCQSSYSGSESTIDILKNVEIQIMATQSVIKDQKRK